MTNYELAVALVRLGARTAMGLGTRHVDGDGVRRHAAHAAVDASEHPIADALLLSYNGVYVAPPVSATLSPNGDGVDDIRPSRTRSSARLR